MAHLAMQRKLEPLQPGDILTVVHDFDARGTDELTLRKSEKIELVELDDGFGDGWYLGRHLTRETTGLFPAVYTTKLPTQSSMKLPTGLNQPFNFVAHTLGDSQSSYAPSNIAGYDSSTSPRPAPYQHKSEPILEEPSNLPEESVGYGQLTSQSPQKSVIPSAYPTHIPGVGRSIGQALSRGHAGQDSPVMNETLNVIDEHITDLSAARQNLGPAHGHPGDSESEYSSHLDHLSYPAGAESDEDEENKLTQEEVSKWDHRQTADHLRKIGVDSRHCEIFEEQEITGDVLLEMDQSFLSMKEYDFGVMGRRLKTWHKIRDFQNSVLGFRPSRQSSLNPRASTESFSRTQSRVLSGGTILPRIPSLIEEPGLSMRHSQQGSPIANGVQVPPLQTKQSGNSINRTSASTSTPPAWKAPPSPGSPGRPSAASIRERLKSRRHSSIDLPKQSNVEFAPIPLTNISTPLKKRSSFDQTWSLTNATPSSTNATTPSTNNQILRAKESLEMPADSVLLSEGPNLDLDRGYFSGNEVENRKARNVTSKKENTGTANPLLDTTFIGGIKKATSDSKKHARVGSADSVRDQHTSILSPASKIYHSVSSKGRFRSSSARNSSPRFSAGGLSPTVTNLEKDRNSPLPPLPSPIAGSPYAMGTVSLKARKIMGIRATSEAVTENEKHTANTGAFIPGSLEESPVDSPDGSRTPSGRSRSLDIDNDSSSKNTDQVGSTLSSKPSSRTRVKTKQETSAYTRGLLQISPSEARKHCDYHGWMKKKSSSLITTWKPRLFILRGKRLSYYYSENDTQERGIIDISGHKILVANSDPITTFHATITGATSPASPNPGISSPETSPVMTRSPNGSISGPFYFKLIPPKAGMSRAVQFTRPTIHYFQVDTMAEGRKWMGEIMKATIEHDLSSFETTNKQKTISLAKARARRERPPALKETESMPILDTIPQPVTPSVAPPATQPVMQSDVEPTLQPTVQQQVEPNTEPIIQPAVQVSPQPAVDAKVEAPIRENGLKIHGLGLVKGGDTITLLEALRHDTSPAAETEKTQTTVT